MLMSNSASIEINSAMVELYILIGEIASKSKRLTLKQHFDIIYDINNNRFVCDVDNREDHFYLLESAVESFLEVEQPLLCKQIVSSIEQLVNLNETQSEDYLKILKDASPVLHETELRLLWDFTDKKIVKIQSRLEKNPNHARLTLEKTRLDTIRRWIMFTSIYASEIPTESFQRVTKRWSLDELETELDLQEEK